jgi:hypothetical protein
MRFATIAWVYIFSRSRLVFLSLLCNLGRSNRLVQRKYILINQNASIMDRKLLRACASCSPGADSSNPDRSPAGVCIFRCSECEVGRRDPSSESRGFSRRTPGESRFFKMGFEFRSCIQEGNRADARSFEMSDMNSGFHSLPLNGAWRLRADVVHHSIYSWDFIHNTHRNSL